MPEPRWTDISAMEAAVELEPASFCCTYIAPARSPIDGVYAFIQSTVVLGQQAALDANPALGRLLLLGFVSAVDDYFRRVLASLVNICPLARSRVSEKVVTFGALDYYDPAQTGLALFENTSFASLKDLRTQTEQVAGAKIESTSLIEAISKYEKLCHMRHAATHAGGALSSRNARELGMPSGGVVHQVLLNEAQLQASASVCYSAARAYNRWLYRAVLQQWFGKRVVVAVWTQDRDLLQPLFELFRSREDNVAPRTAYQMFRSARPAILAVGAER